MTQFTPKGPMYCRTCEKNQIKTEIYFDNFHKSQSGKSIPLERFGGQPHQCPYSEYALKQNGAQRMPNPQEQIQGAAMYVPQPHNLQQAQITPPTLPQEALLAKIDNLNIGIAKIMSILQNQAENNPTQRDNDKLRQQVTELEEVIKKQGNSFVPANQVQSELEDTTGYDNEVADKIRRGKQADDDGEELEI